MSRFRMLSVFAIPLLAIALTVTVHGQPNSNLSKVDPLLRREAAKQLGKPLAKPSIAAGRIEAPGALHRPHSGKHHGENEDEDE